MHDVHSRRHYMDVTAERADIDKKVSGKTVCTIFADAVRNWPDRTALRWKRDGEWQQLTWREYGDHVAAATLALRDLGFGPGQFGLIMARNVPEHVIADLAIVHAGGAAISVYNTLAPEQLEYVANHSEATVAFVEDEAFLSKFLAIRASAPHLRHIVLVRGSAPEGVIRWDDLLARGRELHEAEPQMFERSWRAVGPEDTVSLIYTSGTTGPPKGVVYSHNNIIWTLESVQRFWAIEPQTLVSYLPLAHVAERFPSQWRGIHLGHEVWLCPDPNQLLPSRRCMSSGARWGCPITKSGAWASSPVPPPSCRWTITRRRRSVGRCLGSKSGWARTASCWCAAGT